MIENISLPEEVEKILDKRSSMGIVGDMGAFAQFQAANSMEKAAENPNGGGIMGAGMGAGLGMGMMGQMANVFQERKFEGNTSPQQSGAAGPPPLPEQQQKSVFYVSQGQQQGPVSLSEIQSLVTSKENKKDI